MKFVLLTFILLTTLPVWAVSVSFSKDNVVIGQVVELIFSSDKKFSQAPDLSSIKNDFHISGQTTRQNTTIVNGKTDTTYELSYNLFPKRVGTLTINGLTLNGQKLNPIQLTVSATEDKNTKTQNLLPLVLQAQVSEGPYYVGQAIVYTVRMGDIRRILDGNFDAPSTEGASVQLLEQDETRTVMQDNKPVQILERKYLITPEQSGKITINPVSFNGIRSIERNKRQSIEDMFEMGILFDGLMGTGSQEQIFASAEPITIQVQPKPSQWQGWWLASPNVQLTYEDKIPVDLKSGDTIERVVTLSAVGVNAEALPVPSQANTPDIKVYPATETRNTVSDNNTIRGILSLSIIMVPTNGGDMTIPAIKVPWFNTITQKSETAIIPEKHIFVNGPKLAQQQIQPTPVKTAIQPIKETTVIPNQSIITTPQMWLWLIIGLIGGGLIVGLSIFILSKIRTHKRKKPLPDLYPF
ncbi:MAG: BatD family protein [Alphaproteobacteria bacterium]|nr:BatD family protein [Alphaproteobacteria bacterium]